MVARSLGGVHVVVEVPDRWAARLTRLGRRRPAGRDPLSEAVPVGPGLDVLAVFPRVSPLARDPDAGLAFVRDRIARRRVPAGTTDLIESQPWYHTLEIPGRGPTAGSYDHRPLVAHYGLPDRLDGQTALDVATGDGFWAFELEGRGATVTALDIESTDSVDLPPAVRRRAADTGVSDPLGDGFALAAELRGSAVRKVVGSVYAMDDLGAFDLVHAGDLLLHIRDPIAALQQIAAATRGQAILSEVFDPALGWSDAARGLTRYHGGWHTAGWWTPALPTLVQMVADAGFSSVETVSIYRLAVRGGSGPWRAVLRARP